MSVFAHSESPSGKQCLYTKQGFPLYKDFQFDRYEFVCVMVLVHERTYFIYLLVILLYIKNFIFGSKCLKMTISILF